MTTIAGTTSEYSDIPIIGALECTPITRTYNNLHAAEDHAVIDLYIGNHLATATRHRYTLRRKSIPILIQALQELQWGSDITHA